MAGRYKAYSEYNDSGVKWLGDLPTHWVVLGLGKAVDFMCNGSAATQHEQTNDSVAVTRIETISDGTFNFEKVGHVWPKDVMERHRLRAGDIQLSNINSLSMVGKCAIYEDTSVLYAGMNLLHIRPSRRVVFPRYMYRQFEAKLFRNRVEASAKPAINQASIPTGTLRSFDFICPPLPEQKQIAHFLDHETGKIDALIEKQQALIALLQEKRQAVISHAVTKGLNPEARMKDSGVEWLGDVPEHWEVVPIKYIVSTPITDGPHETPAFLDEGIPFVSAEAVSSGTINFDKIRGHISRCAHEVYSKKYLPKRGDIYMVKSGATTGVTAIVETDIEFNIWSPLAVIRCKDTSAPYYVLNYLRSSNFLEAVELNWSFGTQQNIGMGVIGNIRIPQPPKDEAEEIAAKLISQNSKYETLVDRALHQIDLLQERRTALISAAVTGKIDVRDWEPAPELTEIN
jgi:type I restriction enzyme S subunit